MDQNKPCYYWSLLLFLLACFVGPSWGQTEAEILLKFKNSLANYGSALADWNDKGSGPCNRNHPNWTGLRCRNGSVFGLKLERMGLMGVIDIETLRGLQLLRTLSFMNNSFSGPFPDVHKLTSLRALYLSYNRFSGEIRDDGFTGMNSLQKVFLARNNFSGQIPKSLATLPRLLQLSLEWNHFEGRIPDFQQDDLSLVNLANNQLQGRIPYRLSDMNTSFFAARRAPGQPGLDWPTRLKIIKGVVKGLAYLYSELSNLTLPYGHLKSSNVLLNHTFDPLLTDYALIPVINKEHALQFMVAYKSPEFSQYNRTTRKTDVWSLGILILELLTGKFPANYLKQGKGRNSDLATWVNSVVREEWTGEVFDKDMKGTKNGEGEMLKLLKIGMCCSEWNIERRWELKEALEKIEELKERDSDNIEESGSEGEVYSSRAITDDDFSFSVHA